MAGLEFLVPDGRQTLEIQITRANRLRVHGDFWPRNHPRYFLTYLCLVRFTCVCFFFCINESFPNLNRRGKVIRSDVPSDSRCMKVKHPNKILTKTFQKKEQKQNESLQSRSCTGRYFKFIPPSVSKFT